MTGFMRQPQIINDPNAAPASLRADDVDLQAQQGDFIMGHPAMQKSGIKVRSLVEQAMLKAKDAGIKTKGYKQGDKVDILVHNGEMHIPKELVSYVEGGYTELKKLNAPSKYDEGDVVGGQGGRTLSDSDTEAMTGGQGGRNLSDVDMSVIGGKGGRTLSDVDVQNKKSGLKLFGLQKDITPVIPAPTQGAVEFTKVLKYAEPLGEKIWKQTNEKLKKIIKSKAFNKGKYVNDMMHKETMTNLKKSIERFGLGNFNADKLLDTSFLVSAVTGTETNYLMDKANFATGNGRLNSEVQIKEDGLEFTYKNGTPDLFGANATPKKYYNRPERNLPGWKVEYEQLVDFLITAEGFDGVPRQDGKQWVIGHGHKITDKDTELLEMLNQNGSITEEYANQLLAHDIIQSQTDARTNYNKHTKSKTFDSLDYNSKMIIMEKNFHLGQPRASKYEKLSTAIKSKDWSSIVKESKAKQRINGKLEFTDGMKNRHNKFLKFFVNPYFSGT